MSPATIIKQHLPLSGSLSFIFLHSPPSSPDMLIFLSVWCLLPHPRELGFCLIQHYTSKTRAAPGTEQAFSKYSCNDTLFLYLLLLSAQGSVHWRCSQTCLLSFMFIIGARQHFDFTSGRNERFFFSTYGQGWESSTVKEHHSYRVVEVFV